MITGIFYRCWFITFHRRKCFVLWFLSVISGRTAYHSGHLAMHHSMEMEKGNFDSVSLQIGLHTQLHAACCSQAYTDTNLCCRSIALKQNSTDYCTYSGSRRTGFRRSPFDWRRRRELLRKSRQISRATSIARRRLLLSLRSEDLLFSLRQRPLTDTLTAGVC